jgi:hypothetical protein
MMILGMDYQTFWAVFVVMVGILAVVGLLILWSIARSLSRIAAGLRQTRHWQARLADREVR